MTDDLAALHEAGHACAYLSLPSDDAQIRSVELTGEGGGRCRARYRRLSIEQQAVCMLAGLAAELHFIHGPTWRPRATDLDPTVSDVQHVRLLLVRHPKRELLLRDAWHAAAALTRVEWHRVVRIAEALHSARFLSGDDVLLLWKRS